MGGPGTSMCSLCRRSDAGTAVAACIRPVGGCCVQPPRAVAASHPSPQVSRPRRGRPVTCRIHGPLAAVECFFRHTRQPGEAAEGPLWDRSGGRAGWSCRSARRSSGRPDTGGTGMVAQTRRAVAGEPSSTALSSHFGCGARRRPDRRCSNIGCDVERSERCSGCGLSTWGRSDRTG